MSVSMVGLKVSDSFCYSDDGLPFFFFLQQGNGLYQHAMDLFIHDSYKQMSRCTM